MSTQKQIKVLIVDDKADLRKTYVTVLPLMETVEVPAADGTVETKPLLVFDEAASLAEAMAKAQSNVFDVILLDLKLPDSSGIETIKAMTHFRVPIIVLTGSARLIEEDAIRAGAVEFVMKASHDDSPEKLAHTLKIASIRHQSAAHFEDVRCTLNRVSESLATIGTIDVKPPEASETKPEAIVATLPSSSAAVTAGKVVVTTTVDVK